MSSSPDESGSTVASARRLTKLLLATLSNRAELLLVEFQEQRLKLLEVLVLGLVLVILGTLALVVVSFTVVVILWEHRVAALVVLSVLYLGAAVAVYLQLRRRLRNWEAFTSTLDEFQKDRAWLKDQH
jgi:uncharacterized membrane protein YqjE